MKNGRPKVPTSIKTDCLMGLSIVSKWEFGRTEIKFFNETQSSNEGQIGASQVFDSMSQAGWQTDEYVITRRKSK